jgi:hypothetical protein
MKLRKIAPGFQLVRDFGEFDFAKNRSHLEQREDRKLEAESKAPEFCIRPIALFKRCRVLFFRAPFCATGMGKSSRKICRGWIRTNDTQSQSLVTYHLSTRQQSSSPCHHRRFGGSAEGHLSLRTSEPFARFRRLGVAGIKIQNGPSPEDRENRPKVAIPRNFFSLTTPGNVRKGPGLHGVSCHHSVITVMCFSHRRTA